MNVTLQFWQLVVLLLTFFGFCGTVARVLLTQIDKRLDMRFSSLEAANKTVTEASKAGDAAILDALKRHIAEEAKNSAQLIDLERQLLNWKADLPLTYVRREDFIRNQTIIESKLDGLALRFENAQLKGGSPHA